MVPWATRVAMALMSGARGRSAVNFWRGGADGVVGFFGECAGLQRSEQVDALARRREVRWRGCGGKLWSMRSRRRAPLIPMLT